MVGPRSGARITSVLLFATLAAALSGCGGDDPNRTTRDGGLDFLILGARVFDGSGSPWIDAAVGIAGDRIAYVGPRASAPEATEIIDATGLVAAPGFIDVHTHAGGLRDPGGLWQKTI